MADQAKIGTDWAADELDAIVADYFAMLALERAGRPYVKRQRALALMARIGRSHASVERKHMNISAVLQGIGRDAIPGYKPADHYQGAIIDAVERYFKANPAVAFPALVEPEGFREQGRLMLEPAPPLDLTGASRPAQLQRLARQYGWLAIDARNRGLGKAGEALVVDFERARLAALDRADLARKVRWVAQEDGDGPGYDILSFDTAGHDRLIEVKTTQGPRTTPFFLTRNERSLADERPDAFRIFRVYEFSSAKRLFKLRPPLEAFVRLEAETWRASFG